MLEYTSEYYYKDTSFGTGYNIKVKKGTIRLYLLSKTALRCMIAYNLAGSHTSPVANDAEYTQSPC